MDAEVLVTVAAALFLWGLAISARRGRDEVMDTDAGPR